MMRALYSAVSGLSGNMLRMDVIGNNIANVNTTGFKAGRAGFAEAFAQMSRAAGAPGDGRGGTNPIQIGCGAVLGSAAQLYTQGSLQTTGVGTDLAVQGSALFVLGDGRSTYYTRDGAFQIDAAGRFVSPGGGLLVQGYLYDRDGETYGGELAAVQIPIYGAEPARASGTIELLGNLDADSAPRGSVLQTGALLDAGGAAATRDTALVDLRGGAGSEPLLAAGDAIDLAATVGGESVGAQLAVASGTTLGQLLDAITQLLDSPAGASGAAATLDAQGRVRIATPDASGTAGAVGSLTLSAADGEGEARAGFADALAFDDLVAARDASAFTRTVRIYDSLGFAHDLELTFTRVPGANEFAWSAALGEGNGAILEGATGRVRFRGDGSFESLTYDAQGGRAPAATRLRTGTGALETLSLSLSGGESGGFGGLTMVSGGASLEGRADGYAAGVFNGFEVDELGRVLAYFSNGVSRPVARLALAEFVNPSGLTRVGHNAYLASANSGAPVLGAAGDGTIQASIVAGALEQSNVDLAREFTDMIVAQRGFQANARVISASDEMLAGLIQVLR